MSNIAGKAYSMNLMTPITRKMILINKLIFWIAGTPYFSGALNGLRTLSLIHYARWVVVGRKQFPHVSPDQPEEDLEYNYMFFNSNFNGSWTQYVDSFSMAIPSGLNLLWKKNVGWPDAVPETPFNRYVINNQIWSSHYYCAYPMAASNDVKAGQSIKGGVEELSKGLDSISAADFRKKYDATTKKLENDISMMAPTPVVSLANLAIEKRERIEEGKK
ncbi:MAG: hypothetical protein HRT71_16400 [Flavobacteriales bacterium]|nr:hypothetical protein [Flavobacteriales bacterium]